MTESSTLQTAMTRPVTSLSASLAAEQPAINIALSEATADLPALVLPIVRHVLGPGGKRLRPLLTVFVARLLGYTAKDIYPLAAAIEMFHVATLLHDDVLDNAVLRRGQTAAHQVFGVTETILAGDALLAKGNHVVASYSEPRLTASTAEAIARTAGGEILELEQQGKLSENLLTYLEVITGKTAWMIRTACEIGAILAKASPSQIAAAAEYGLNLGMAFQLVDDALDFAPSAQTGKPEGGDVREGKCTPPISFYWKTLDAPEQELFAATFAEQRFTDAEVKAVTLAIREQGLDDKTRTIADTYLQRAQDALDKLTTDLPSASAPFLSILTDFIIHVRDRNA
ncbi:MAG: polyprenyl synthetase family protein [Bilophila sp.]